MGRRSESPANFDHPAIYIVFFKPGPAWVVGRGSREQPCWDEHAAFMDRLYGEGHVLLGGPYYDFSRVMVVVRASGEGEAENLFRDDPWTESRVLTTDEIHRWSVFLGPAAWRDSN